MQNECDKITVEITCSSEECDQLREEGLFFAAIADALGIDRDDVKEVDGND